MTAKIVAPDHTYGSATLVITASVDAELGTVPLVISGAAERHATKALTYSVTVVPEGGGSVSVTFAGCPEHFRPVWFAAQDGSGPWTQIVGSDDEYQFNVKSARGGYVFVLGTGYRDVRVTYATSEELTRSPIVACGPWPTSYKTVFAQFASVGAKDVVSVGLGGYYNAHRFVGPISTPFAFTYVPQGPQDLIAYRDGESSDAAAVVIRRDLNVPDYANLGTVSFASDEAFAPATAPVHLTGLARSPGYSMAYFAGADCSYYDLYDRTDAWKLSSPFDLSGIPASRQRAGDFHQISVYDRSPGAKQSRSVTESFHTLAPRTIDMPDLPTPSVLFVSGAYTRFQATITSASAETSAQLRYFFRENSRVLTVDATSGWLGAQSTTLTVPDFSAVSGWQKEFLAVPGEPVSWQVTTTSANEAARGGNCSEGARWATNTIWGVR